MTEHNIDEPLWVGIDIDAEHARYLKEDRLRAADAVTASPAPESSLLGRALRAAFPAMGRGGVPRLRPSA